MKKALKWTGRTQRVSTTSSDDQQISKYAKDIKEKETPTDEVCLKCNTPGMVQKLGRFGKYLKCNSCGATRDAEPPPAADAAAATADGEEEIENCELCGKPMQLKRGRFGPFYGCSGYPECKTSARFPRAPVTAAATAG